MIVSRMNIQPGPHGIDLHRLMRLANRNAALWAIGNGLVSTLLVIYLAGDLGATGLGISLILAAPRFAGLLRLATPAIMGRFATRKTLAISAYALSSFVLCTVPIAALIQTRVDADVAI